MAQPKQVEKQKPTASETAEVTEKEMGAERVERLLGKLRQRRRAEVLVLNYHHEDASLLTHRLQESLGMERRRGGAGAGQGGREREHARACKREREAKSERKRESCMSRLCLTAFSILTSDSIPPSLACSSGKGSKLGLHHATTDMASPRKARAADSGAQVMLVIKVIMLLFSCARGFV